MGNTTKEFDDISHDDIVYLAGIFSVAGNVCIKKMNHKDTLHLSIQSKNRVVIERIARMFKTKVSVVGLNGNRAILVGSNARAMLDILLPYMDKETANRVILTIKLS